MEGRTSSTGQARARPGWYADPHEDGRLRKWDGERWTDLWMAAPGMSAGATTVAAHPVSAAGWYDDPYVGDDVARQRFWDGEVWTHRLRHGRTFRGRPPLAGWFVGVAWALRAALLLNGLGAAAGLGMAIWTLSLTDQALNGAGFGDAEAAAYDTLDLVVLVATSLVYLLTIPLFLTWLSAAYRNDRVDPGRLTHSRGWAVGAWFVPILNLARPYRIVADLRQGVRSGLGDERPDPYPRSVGWWWGAWLVMNVAVGVSEAAFRAMDRAEGGLAFLDAWRVTGWTGIAASLTTAVAAYLAYTLVSRITAGLRRPEFRDPAEGLPGR